MVLKVRDIVDRCYSNDDGLVVFEALKGYLHAGRKVRLSFKGIHEVTSSFVNTALIDLLDVFEFSVIKSRIEVVDSTRQINDLILRRFKYEVENRVGQHD